MTRSLAVWVVLGMSVAWSASAESNGYAVHGRVLAEDGTPIPEATVWLAQQREVRTTQADQEGVYAFDNVRPAAIELVAHQEGYSIGGFTAYALGPDEVDIVLYEPDTLELRIINESYEPVEGARLTAIGVGGLFQISMNDLIEGGFPVYRSDAEGVLTIPDLPKDSHVAFTVSHIRYAATYIPYLPVGGPRQSIQIYPGATVRGRVSSQEEEGVEGARVVIFQPRERRHYVADEVVTDGEGFYRAVIRPGNYYVTADAPDYAPAWPVAVAAVPGEDENVADLQLPPARYLEGRVVGEDKIPFPGVQLQYWVGDSQIQQTLSQYDGRFRMKVAPGDGRIRVVPPDGYVPVERLDMLVEIDEVVVSSLGDIEVEPIPTIEGTAVDGEGEPISRAIVVPLGIEPPLWAVTDDEGQFSIRMITFPDEGRVTVQVEHPVRLLRRELIVDFDSLEHIRAELEPYTPDTAPDDPEQAPNDLREWVNESAPAWTCASWFNSEPLTLEALRGKVVVLTLWSGFDVIGPGRDRIEELRALHHILQDVEDVVFVGIHTGDVPDEQAEEYTEQFGIEFPVGLDVEEATTFERYGIRAIPQTVLIDRQGVMRYFDVDGRLLELIKSLRMES